MAVALRKSEASNAKYSKKKKKVKKKNKTKIYKMKGHIRVQQNQ